VRRKYTSSAVRNIPDAERQCVVGCIVDRRSRETDRDCDCFSEKNRIQIDGGKIEPDQCLEQAGRRAGRLPSEHVGYLVAPQRWCHEIDLTGLPAIENRESSRCGWLSRRRERPLDDDRCVGDEW
jgi:hypothetical protein